MTASFKRLFIYAFLLASVFILGGCKSDTRETGGKTEDTPRNEEVEEQSEFPQGVNLVVEGMDPSYEEIFHKHFEIVKKGHQNMIMRETEKTKELFPENRPDLANAVLFYNAYNNTALYVFDYKPRPQDITINDMLIVMQSASYMYIQNSLNSYFFNIQLDLKDRGISFTQPRKAYKFQKSEDEYILVEFPSSAFDAAVQVKLAGDPTVYRMYGSFATWPVKLAVANPVKSLQGRNSSEVALLKFFNIEYDDLLQGSQVNLPEEGDDVGSYENPSADFLLTGNGRFKDEKFGISFSYPSDWDNKVGFSYEEWQGNETIEFIYNSPETGNSYFVFSIVIENGVIQEHEWENPMDIYLGSGKGKTFSLSMPGDPSAELLKEENAADLEYIGKMLGDTEIIADTFNVGK